jgi:hypothetical protein
MFPARMSNHCAGRFVDRGVASRVAVAAVTAFAAIAALALAACGGPGGGGADRPAAGPTGNAAVGGAPNGSPSAGPSRASPTAGPTAKPPAAAKPLTCAALRQADVTTASVKLSDYRFDSITLADGRWAAEDGTEIELQAQCGIGDLTSDGAADAVGVVRISMGGTGRFYSLVAWRNSAGTPALADTLALGDRNPVTAITIASQRVTVVYLTRTDGSPMAALNLKRTAVFRVSGTTFVEESHTDEPYTP